MHASLEEHQEALALIQDLQGLAPGCPEFENKFQALVLNVEHHMTEEETVMFPLAEAEVKEDLRTCGTRCCTSRPTCSHRNETSGPWAAAVCRGWPSLGRAQAPAISSRVSPGAAQSPWPARRLAAAWPECSPSDCSKPASC